VAETSGWDRWLWLGGSLLLAVAAAQTMWWLEQAEGRNPRVRSLLTWPLLPPSLLLLRALFYLGLPLAALVWGRDALIGRWLGLQPLYALDALLGQEVPPAEIAANWGDWAKDVGWALGLGVAAWTVLATGWLSARRALQGQQTPRPSSPWESLLEATFHEAHWAFYRNGPMVALGTYWGVWGGLGLTALEAALNPRWRANLCSPAHAPATLTRAGMAVLSAVLFLLTQNLWAAMLTHWAVTWGLTAWIARRS